MKIEIMLRDFRQPLRDISEQEASQRIRQLEEYVTRYDNGGESYDAPAYMDLGVFLRHLRDGKFGSQVHVTFSHGQAIESVVEGGHSSAQERGDVIVYTVVSNDAPEDAFFHAIGS